ncbi:hypothetical protein B0H14DRAFT_2851835 [Mycena olivaceomarginata]|nr:hypothetical protein B0H14DRAFT_2851835 [Mycena olivaceomarginata]
MSAAQDTVISMPELLELILALLPMRHLLLVAPLVSKTWQAITLTPGPQRTLFFQPDLGSEPIQNPLLVEAEDAFKREGASWRRMLVTQPPARTMTVVETWRMDAQSSSQSDLTLTVVRSCAPNNRQRFKSDEWRGADIKWQKFEVGVEIRITCMFADLQSHIATSS